ncbi:MAG: outer membrane protein assembly factor BamA [Deltaproteobacteria bacterium]|nr:outer membrane protein assembly factor BamA [Deltaproteobacteria bacterium]
MRFIRLTLVITAFLTVFALNGPASAGQQKIRVLMPPFDTAGDAAASSRLRRDVMESLAAGLASIGAEIAGIEELKELVLKEGVTAFTEERAKGLGHRVKADFVLLGALKSSEASFGVELRFIDLTTGAEAASYSRSSASVEALLDEAGRLADHIYRDMLIALSSRPAVKSGVIDSIAVSGNRRVDTAAVMKKITSRTGGPFSPDDVREDIRAIYSTGFFDDVYADLSDTNSGKVLTFVVREMPFIKKISVEGNTEIKEERFKDLINIKENTVLDRSILYDAAAKIKALYAEEGFYLAKVGPEIKSDGVEAEVLFKIEEGPEVKVRRITVIGARHYGEEDIKDLMNTDEKGLFSFLTRSGKFSEFVFTNDLALIMGHYYDNGFINADILDRRILLSDDKLWLYITIALTEGEQYRFGDIDLSGDMLDGKKELLEKIKSKKDSVFDRSKLGKDVDVISDFYGDKGYAYADIRPLTKPDNGKKTVDVTFDIKKNDPVFVERIDITGNVTTRDKVIRREMEVDEGSLFSSSGLKRSRNNLRRLGFFEDVRIAQSQGHGPDKMKLDVEVKERPTGSISIGMGYSSVDKLVGTASISEANFLGTGIRLDLSGTVSATSSKYVIGFTEPWLMDKPLSAGFDLYNTEKQYPDFDIRKDGFDLRFGFPLYGRYTRGSLTYKNENVEVFNVADTAASYIREQEGKNRESSVRAAVRQDTRDDAFFPTEGSVLSFSTDFAGGPLGGTVYYVKYEGDAVRYFPLPFNTTFSVHGSAGYVHSYDGRDVPIYQKYFLGGINTIRGFETRSISPVDELTGDLIGGKGMFVLNAEFLFPLFTKQNVKGVLFFDAGNSYASRLVLTDLRTGAGAGIRWFSPIGPLRLELGFNLDRRPGEAGDQWDFTIGTMF